MVDEWGFALVCLDAVQIPRFLDFTFGAMYE